MLKICFEKICLRKEQNLGINSPAKMFLPISWTILVLTIKAFTTK
jgi:hypothetical protein